MFEGLRKKLSEAIGAFAKRENAKEEKEERQKEAAPEEGIQTAVPEERARKTEETKPIEEGGKEEGYRKEREITPVKEERKAERMAPAKTEEAKTVKKEKQEKQVKVALATKLKGVFSSTVTLSEGEIEGFVENVRLSMLESDVSFDATEAFTERLKERLKTARIDAKDIQGSTISTVRGAMLDTLEGSAAGKRIDEAVKEGMAAGRAPFKILFLGPNGTGKTTTIGKVAHLLKEGGITCVMAACDTFRAAAIEQTEMHAKRLGVPVIKNKYGSDPASIAFDAIAYAKAHGTGAVLIDSAGRQENNKNLISEMQKMVRVAQPDMTVFVGESTAGNALSEQVAGFNKSMKVDGIILTKLDCDAKGGNAISIAYTTGIPILYLGTGEGYADLERYSPERIVDMILPGTA